MELMINGHLVSDPNDKVPDNQILKVTSRSHPEWIFEYHPASKKVYRINILERTLVNGTTTDKATLLAKWVYDHLAAKSIITAYVNGYNEGMASVKGKSIHHLSGNQPPT